MKAVQMQSRFSSRVSYEMIGSNKEGPTSGSCQYGNSHAGCSDQHEIISLQGTVILKYYNIRLFQRHLIHHIFCLPKPKSTGDQDCYIAGHSVEGAYNISVIMLIP